jgi:hypothetical protein
MKSRHKRYYKQEMDNGHGESENGKIRVKRSALALLAVEIGPPIFAPPSLPPTPHVMQATAIKATSLPFI